MMDLDQLQSVRDRERQTDKLQQLRETFYADAAALVADLREERDRAAAEAEDPFDDPRVSRLSDQINTAERTVEAIYEKRVGKLVKAASFAAADLPAETEGMTNEEQDLFDDLVADIRANRRRVLDVLAGEVREGGAESSDDAGPKSENGGPESGDGGPASADGPTPSDGVNPAAVMGGEEQSPPAPPEAETVSPGEGAEDESKPGPDPSSGDGDQTEGGDGAREDGGEGAKHHGGDVDGPGTPQVADSDRSEALESTTGSGASDGDGNIFSRPESEPGGSEEGQASPEGDVGDGGSDLERTTVRITRDVGEVFGVDERSYDLEPDQVVDLPTANAKPLLEQDAAEQIE
ncbi:MAG: hypothetical protein V5A43_00905 [Haloarculaceae archaeon]